MPLSAKGGERSIPDKERSMFQCPREGGRVGNLIGVHVIQRGNEQLTSRFYSILIYVYLCVYYLCADAHRGQKWVLGLLELEVPAVVSFPVWVLGLELVLEHGSGKESCEENSECLWEHLKNRGQKSCDLSFFKHGIVLENHFLLLPGVADRSEVTSDSSVLLAFGFPIKCLHYPLCSTKEKHVSLPRVTCCCDYIQIELMKTLLMWPLLTLSVSIVWTLNKVDYCRRYQSASFIGSILPGPATSRVVANLGPLES